MLSTAACLGIAGLSNTPAMAAGDTIKVAYSLDYFMSSPALAKKWFAEIKQQFEAAHPGDTLQPVPIPGSFFRLQYENQPDVQFTVDGAGRYSGGSAVGG